MLSIDQFFAFLASLTANLGDALLGVIGPDRMSGMADFLSVFVQIADEIPT